MKSNSSQITATDSRQLSKSEHNDTTSSQINIMDVNDEKPQFEKGKYNHNVQKNIKQSKFKSIDGID